MDNVKEYFAFISYKREDEKWAKWLQNKLEHYKLPSNMNGRTDLPKEIRPIFRDQSELAGGVLADEINKALTNSKYLIVICSPRAAQSQWVGKEVQSFIDMGRTDKIIPFIIGGTAHAQNPEEECFPFALLNLPPEQELLGINIDEMGRDAAAVKVVAQMFGLKFDALWQRYEREQRKKRTWSTMVIVGAFLVLLGVSFWMYRQWWRMKENQARFVAEKANAIVDDDPYLAQRLLLEVLPKNIKHPNKPITSEVENAFRNAVCKNYIKVKTVSNYLYTVSLSPDRNRVVSATNYNKVLIWDAETGQNIKLLEGHTDGVNYAEYSPDGNYIVSASYDSTVRIWEAETSEVYRVLKGHREVVWDANFSKDGKMVLSNSADSTIRLWSVESGKEIMTIPGVVGAISPNCKYVSSISLAGAIQMWSIEKKELLYTIPYNSPAHCIDFSPDNRRIVVAYENQATVIWDVETENRICMMGDSLSMDYYHYDFMYHVAAYSPDGRYVLTVGSFGNIIRIWDAETGEKLSSLDGRRFEFFPDGRHLLSISWDNKNLLVFDFETQKIKEIVVDDSNDVSLADAQAFINSSGKIVATLRNGTRMIWDMDYMEYTKRMVAYDKVEYASFSPDGGRIVAGLANGSVEVWDVSSGERLNVYYGNGTIYEVMYSPDGRHILSVSPSTSPNGMSTVWDVDSDDVVCTIDGYRARYSPDGKHLVAISKKENEKTSQVTCQIVLYDAHTGAKIKELAEYPHYIEYVAYSSEGDRIVTVSYDNRIIIWDADTGEQLNQLLESTTFCSAEFDPEGKCIVAGIYDNTMFMIWEIETGKKRFINESDFTVLSASYSHDGNYIVSVFDNDIRVWDAEKGTLIQNLEGHTKMVVSALFSPDDSCIVSASYDGTIRIWPIPPLQKLIDQTRERFKDRPLTPEERHQYYLE